MRPMEYKVPIRRSSPCPGRNLLLESGQLIHFKDVGRMHRRTTTRLLHVVRTDCVVVVVTIP